MAVPRVSNAEGMDARLESMSVGAPSVAAVARPRPALVPASSSEERLGHSHSHTMASRSRRKKTLEMGEAVEHLKMMFPSLDAEIFEAVLLVNDGSINRTIDYLIELTSTEAEPETAAGGDRGFRSTGYATSGIPDGAFSSHERSVRPRPISLTNFRSVGDRRHVQPPPPVSSGQSAFDQAEACDDGDMYCRLQRGSAPRHALSTRRMDDRSAQEFKADIDLPPPPVPTRSCRGESTRSHRDLEMVPRPPQSSQRIAFSTVLPSDTTSSRQTSPNATLKPDVDILHTPRTLPLKARSHGMASGSVLQSLTQSHAWKEDEGKMLTEPIQKALDALRPPPPKVLPYALRKHHQHQHTELDDNAPLPSPPPDVLLLTPEREEAHDFPLLPPVPSEVLSLGTKNRLFDGDDDFSHLPPPPPCETLPYVAKKQQEEEEILPPIPPRSLVSPCPASNEGEGRALSLSALPAAPPKDFPSKPKSVGDNEIADRPPLVPKKKMKRSCEDEDLYQMFSEMERGQFVLAFSSLVQFVCTDYREFLSVKSIQFVEIDRLTQFDRN